MVGIQKLLDDGEDIIARYPNVTFTHICVDLKYRTSIFNFCASRKISAKMAVTLAYVKKKQYLCSRFAAERPRK